MLTSDLKNLFSKGHLRDVYLSHMAVHHLHHLHHLHYHYFYSELKTWPSANPLLHKHFALVPDWLYGLSDH